MSIQYEISPQVPQIPREQLKDVSDYVHRGAEPISVIFPDVDKQGFFGSGDYEQVAFIDVNESPAGKRERLDDTAMLDRAAFGHVAAVQEDGFKQAELEISAFRTLHVEDVLTPNFHDITKVITGEYDAFEEIASNLELADLVKLYMERIINGAAYDPDVNHTSSELNADSVMHKFYNRGHGKRMTTFRQWRHEFVPHAKALQTLYFANNVEQLRTLGLDRDNFDFKSWCQLMLSPEGVAIRNRGTAVAEVTKNILMERVLRDPSEPLNIVSAGCGTAEPTWSAAVVAQREIDKLVQSGRLAKNPRLHHKLVDLSEASLRGAQASEFYYYSKFGLETDTEKERGNVFKVLEDLEDRSQDFIEMTGLLEYLPRFTFNASSDPEKVKNRYGAAYLVAMAYQKLKPGGSLLFGNMTVDSESFAVNQTGVSWPMLYAQRPEQLIEDIVDGAGINRQNLEVTGAVDTTIGNSEPVYYLYHITKSDQDAGYVVPEALTFEQPGNDFMNQAIHAAAVNIARILRRDEAGVEQEVRNIV